MRTDQIKKPAAKSAQKYVLRNSTFIIFIAYLHSVRIFLQVKLNNLDKTPIETDVLRDQGSKRGTIKSTEEIMANGGCKVAQTIYENGQEWHPVLPSHGEQKCITCHCKVSLNKHKSLTKNVINCKLYYSTRTLILLAIGNAAYAPFATIVYLVKENIRTNSTRKKMSAARINADAREDIKTKNVCTKRTETDNRTRLTRTKVEFEYNIDCKVYQFILNCICS